MTNCIAIPYSSQQERYEITKELQHKGQRYSDLGGIIFSLQYIGNDEMRTGKLIWEYRTKINISES